MIPPLAIVTLLVQIGAVPTPTPSPTPRLSEEVVVTASRVETSSRDVPASLVVLTEDDMRTSAAVSTDDLLRSVPGFSLFRQASSRVSGATTNGVSLRGLGGTAASRTLVLVDGFPLTDAYTSTVSFQRVPVDSIESVEVVRGGGSVAWGNLALGGVINLRTRPAASNDAAVAAEVGEAGFQRASASVSRGRPGLGARLLGAYSNFDGYQLVRADQRGMVDEPSGSIQRNLDFRGDWEPTQRLRLNAGASLFSESLHRGSPLTRDRSNARTLRVDAEFATGSGSAIRGMLGHVAQNGRAVFSTIALNRQTEALATDRYDLPASSWAGSLIWSRGTTGGVLLSAGADILAHDVNPAEFNTLRQGVLALFRDLSGRQRASGAFAQVNAPLGSRLLVLASARLDSISYSNLTRVEGTRATGQATRTDIYSKPDVRTANPSVGLVFHIAEAVTAKASAYRGFRTPTISELVQPFRAFGNVIGEGNALLTPEYVTGVEGGVHFARGARRVAVTGFWNSLSDPIVTVTLGQAGTATTTIAPCGVVPAGGACRQRQNLGRLRSAGLEVEFRQRLGRTQMDASYLWNKTRILDAGSLPELEGKENRNAPRHQLSAGATFQDPRLFSLSLRGRYVSARFDDDLNSLVVGQFFVADMHLSRKWGSRLETFAAVENLLDHEYEVARTTSGVVTIGGPRLLRVGARVRF